LGQDRSNLSSGQLSTWTGIQMQVLQLGCLTVHELEKNLEPNELLFKSPPHAHGMVETLA
jgi:hypothetical protein